MNFKKINFILISLLLLSLGCKQANSKTISVATPNFSMDDKYIVFAGIIDDKKSIYHIKPDGSDLLQLTKPFSKRDGFPVFFPNKKYILFSTAFNKNGCNDLSIMNVYGTNIERITKGGTGGIFPQITKDGRTVFFTSSCPLGGEYKIFNHLDIYSLDIKNKIRNQVTHLNDFGITNLSLSPDNKLLMFERMSFIEKLPEAHNIWIYNIEKQCLYPILPDVIRFIKKDKQSEWDKRIADRAAFADPQFSPDSKSIIFVWPGFYQGYGGHEIYLMNLKSLKTERITDLKGFIRDPAFSNDGKKIAFSLGTNYKNGAPRSYDLWIINTDGSDPKRIYLKLADSNK